MWLPNGTLRIIDRRKHIFKLSQGEYIVPEKIENIYTLSQYVNQVYVYGESLKVSFWLLFLRESIEWVSITIYEIIVEKTGFLVRKKYSFFDSYLNS